MSISLVSIIALIMAIIFTLTIYKFLSIAKMGFLKTISNPPLVLRVSITDSLVGVIRRWAVIDGTPRILSSVPACATHRA